MIDRTCFTIVFEGDVGKLPNPFTMPETPFGKVLTVARGDVCEERDELERQLDRLQPTPSPEITHERE